LNAVRRFYERASVKAIEGGFGVALDERTLRTPKGAVFASPTQALAAACAEEWAAQRDQIIPASMPVTQLAFASIDWTRPARGERIDYILAHARTDLLCHRADAPAELVTRQERTWGPLVQWAAHALNAPLPVVTGIIAAEAPHASLDALRRHAEAQDDFRLTALSQATGVTGSAILAFAIVEGRIGAADAFDVAALDNLWSLERWGEDEEARARLERMRAELLALGRFVEALR